MVARNDTIAMIGDGAGSRSTSPSISLSLFLSSF